MNESENNVDAICRLIWYTKHKGIVQGSFKKFGNSVHWTLVSTQITVAPILIHRWDNYNVKPTD